MSTSAPLCTWSGHDESAATCARCGSVICEHCAGERPNEAWCSACDHRYGAMPLDARGARRSALGAGIATLGQLARGPSAAAARVGVEGPLVRPLAFASLALALHGLGVVGVYGGLYWQSIAGALERFGASDSLGRVVMAAGVLPSLVTFALAFACAIAVAPASLVLASRAVGATVDLRASARACSYACGYLVLAPTPFLGALAYLVAIYFLGRWLAATTQLSRARCAAAIGIHVVSSWIALRAATQAIDALLRTHVESVLAALLG